MKPMYLKDVERFEAPGERGHTIRQMRGAGIPVPQIMHLLAYKPDCTDHLWKLTQTVMRGPSPLSPGQRELIAAFTSRLNECSFCVGSHAAVAAELLGDRALVEDVLADYHRAPISDEEKALFAFVEKVIRHSKRVSQADVDEAKGAGWTDESLYDAITVCALFNFYNVWVSATGVQDLPALMYAMAGIQIASAGYTQEVVPGHAL
jgi:uncharacterized peroxidase-related enzyme